ncbi:MAG TPA: ABC transporter permease [Acidobacteriaceae bacterium]|nr:ABC transporter permease [Acidobacteriaceae bacterium]
MRHCLRQLAKAPGFALTAVLTLALGIGANTAVFSTLDALLLRMLPVRDPQSVYRVMLMNGGTQPPNTAGTGHGNTSFSFPVYQALHTQTRVFSALLAHVPLSGGKVPIRYGKTPDAEPGEEVSGDFFSGLGVRMVRGAGFAAADEQNHSGKVVIGYGLWTRAFARDPGAIGQTLFIKNVPFTVVGITPPAFFGVDPGAAVSFWIPLQDRPELNAWGVPGDRGTLYNWPKWWAVPMVARLQPGVTPQQAVEALQPVFWQAAGIGAGPLDAKRWPAHLGFAPIEGIANYERAYRTPVEIMMALAGLVLLIACTNVALLILARNAAREREFAVRMATGAQMGRLFRQLLTESTLLVGCGAGLGWALALGATRALAAWARIDTGLAPDRNVLLFTLAVACLVALGFSLAPLRSLGRISLEQALRSTSAGMSASRHRVRSGNAAMAFQIAICFTLLVAAGLTLRTLLRYEHEDLGMDADQLLAFDVLPQGPANDGQAWSFYNQLLDRLRAAPGVEAASLAQWRPGSGWLQSGGVKLDGKQLTGNNGARAEIDSNSVGPQYFHTMGIPVLLGRDVSASDTPKSPPVVLVNETFAQRYLPGGALGHRIDGAEIVGVVKDSRLRSVTEPAMPTDYFPLAQMGMRGQMTVEVRTAGAPMALLPEMREVVQGPDPNLPLQSPMTQAAQFERSYVTPLLFARLAMGFGVLAIVLVGTGLYGTLAYRVERRRGEIGLRMALGAPRRAVLRMVLAESLLLCAAGLAAGIPLALAVGSLLRSQLYLLSFADPLSFAAAGMVTLGVALAATLMPARRAARVDPMAALRTE